jgi:hypothetical protein
MPSHIRLRVAAGTARSLRAAWLLVGCWALLSLAHAPPTRADDPLERERCLAGLAARREALQTGTFHYRYGLLFAAPEAPRPWPWDPAPDNGPRELTLTIAGPDWVIRWPGHPIVNLHRAAYDATYKGVVSDDFGGIRAGLVLNGSQETLPDQAREDFKFRLLQGGTVPWQPLWDHLVEHWEAAVDRGEELIDGEPCRVWEWSLPGADFSVLESYSQDLSLTTGMLLRLSVIPAKGYVVRRLDYCTPDGRMTTRFDSEDLREVAPGLWFPWNYYYIRNHVPRGQGYFVEQFTVLDVTGVNEPVPESAFEIQLPAGTMVWDERPDRPRGSFKIGEPGRLSTIDQAVLALEPPVVPAPTHGRWVLLGLNAVAAGLLLTIWLVRRRHARER